jgi:hypothetical protein
VAASSCSSFVFQLLQNIFLCVSHSFLSMHVPPLWSVLVSVPQKLGGSTKNSVAAPRERSVVDGVGVGVGAVSTAISQSKLNIPNPLLLFSCRKYVVISCHVVFRLPMHAFQEFVHEFDAKMSTRRFVNVHHEFDTKMSIWGNVGTL